MRPTGLSLETVASAGAMTTEVAQRLTILLEKKGVITQEEATEILGVYDPHE